MKLRQWITLLFAAILTGFSGGQPQLAEAQNPALTIENASLRLWPEFDQPGMLVIFDGSFASGAVFPQQVAFPLPVGAHDIQATAKDASGNLLSQPWQAQDGKLIYNLAAAGFQIEYYVDRQPSGNQRDLSYTFQAPYAIKLLQIEVQQPARASAFAMTPAADLSGQQSDGLTYYRLSRANLAAGARVPITIRYSKADQSPSVTPAAGTAASALAGAPQGAGQGAASAPNSILPWLLISIGVLALLGALAYWLLQRQQERASARGWTAVSAGKRAAAGDRGTDDRTAGGQVTGETADAAAAFCARCGRRFGPDDQFCPQCGAARRR